MKLSLSGLERARKSPKKFAADSARKFAGIKPTFPMYWILAAKEYHKLRAKNDPDSGLKAVASFTFRCQSKLSIETLQHEYTTYPANVLKQSILEASSLLKRIESEISHLRSVRS